jgi:hypothetical protein
MVVRYKNKQDRLRWVTRLNPENTSRILTGDDDSVNPQDLEVKLGDTWKCMAQAFRDRDIIPNNLNTHFDVPHNQANKDRGYND